LLAREATLIARFLEGSSEAVSEIDSWIRQAASPFRRRLGEQWEDALQDVRLEITRLLKLDRFRGESSLKTYLWRVTSNACVDRVRGQRKFQWEDVEVIDERGDRAKARAFERQLRDDARDLALRVLAEMSEECKQLWRMIFEGQSYQQMSTSLGVAEGALRVRVLRCRRKAVARREELEGYAAPS
jgi:RNA polymerase sigma factor (sigma-70 family)